MEKKINNSSPPPKPQRNKILESNVLREGRKFSITSLDTFDELMDDGIAVEWISDENNNDISEDKLIKNGSIVVLDCCAMIWDGESVSTLILAEGPLVFTVGKKHVNKGLDIGIRRLKIGEKATIISSHLNAYGVEGLDIYGIPGSSHILYDITVNDVINNNKNSINSPNGAEVLLYTTINDKKLNNNLKVINEGTEVTDDLLSEALLLIGLENTHNESPPPSDDDDSLGPPPSIDDDLSPPPSDDDDESPEYKSDDEIDYIKTDNSTIVRKTTSVIRYLYIFFFNFTYYISIYFLLFFISNRPITKDDIEILQQVKPPRPPPPPPKSETSSSMKKL